MKSASGMRPPDKHTAPEKKPSDRSNAARPAELKKRRLTRNAALTVLVGSELIQKSKVHRSTLKSRLNFVKTFSHFCSVTLKSLFIFCKYGPKFTNVHDFCFGISAICTQNSGEDEIFLDSSQSSCDFAASIFIEIVRK